MLDRLTADINTTARTWLRRPLPIVGAVLTLAVAVGVNLAIFGLVDRALSSPPKLVNDPDRVFTLTFAAPGRTASDAVMTSAPYPVFRTIRDDLHQGGGASAFQRLSTHLDLAGDQRRLEAMIVSSNYFALLGVRPSLGTGFQAEDDRSGAPPRVLLSDSFWRSVLNADTEVIGRPLIIGGLEYRVEGVLPPQFSGHSTARVDVWLPFAAAMRNSPGWDESPFRNIASVLVRLADGETEAAVTARLATGVERSVKLRAIGGSDVGDTDRRVAAWLCGVSLLVLAIGLANAATLLVVRGARSRHDLAIRTAMGASFGRLVRQALIEAFGLATLATIVSLIVATGIDEAVRRTLFPDLITAIGASRRVWAGALLSGTIAALASSLAALSQLPRDAAPLRIEAGWTHAGRRSPLTRALLIAQTTLCVLLLAGAGLVASSLRNLWAQDFGMSLENVVVVDFEQTSAEIPGQDELFDEALGRIASLPGVERITPIDAIPFSGFNVPPIAVPGMATPPGANTQLPYLTAATPDFLKILGVQVVAGRSLTPEDERGGLVVLVNESLARAAWPGASPLGKCIRIGFDPDFNPETFDPSNGPPMPSAAVPCREVVGVTRDVRQRSVLPYGGEDRLMQYFVPFSQAPTPPFASHPTRIRGLMLKTLGDPAALTLSIRRLTLGGRTDLPYLRIRAYPELLERQMRPWVAGTRLLALFSTLALAVAAIGLYAAFAHAVAERRREMAIRMAVGARPRTVVTMVLREALGLVSIGAALGCFATFIAGRWARSLLFGITATDPWVLAAATLLMAIVAALATWAPARTASSADPSLLLRSE